MSGGEMEASRVRTKSRRRNTVLAAIELFREVGLELRMSSALAFLYVCENEGLNIQELAYVCRFNKATASRSIRALAPPESPGALYPALGLVELFPDPTDTRGRLVFLTARGQDVREQLDALIAEAVPIVGTSD